MSDEEVERLRRRVAELEAAAAVGRQATSWLQSLLIAAPAFIMRVDADENVEFLNHFVAGFTPETVYGTPFWVYISPPFQDAARAVVRRAIDDGEPGTYETESPAEGGIARYTTSVAPIVAEDGRRGATLVAVDVTTQLQREWRLLEREATLRLAVEATGLALWSWDTATGVVTWNERMHEITGSATAVAPDRYLHQVHPDDLPMMQGALERLERTGVFESIPHRIVRPDGAVRWVTTFGSALREGGAVVRLVGATLDISEQRVQEEELRQANKMEAVGQLAAGIAHNFNNMLTAILPTFDILEEHVPPEDRPFIEGARHAGRRAAEMIRQLLTFAGKGSFPSSSRPERVVDVARRAVAMCRQVFDPRIQVIEEHHDLGDRVLDDAGAVEQALVNILINARDAVMEASALPSTIHIVVDCPPPGDPEASRLPAASGAELVRFRVRDSGAGMPESVRRRVFEPFFTTKPVGQGTGLGLSTTYAIATARGGTVVCRSEPGSGTEISLLLPTRDASWVSRSTESPREPTKARYTIAVVDDEVAARRVVARVFERAGHTVVEAGTVREAVDLLSQGSPVDLVLLDRSLPDGTGMEVLGAVPGLAERARVVFFSGQEMPDAERVLAHGVLPKPVNAEDLLAMLRQQLSLRVAPRP